MITVLAIGEDTTALQRKCATLKVVDKVIEEVSEITFYTSNYSGEWLSLSVRGGIQSNDIHSYSGGDAYETFKRLRDELSDHGIKFDSRHID